MHPIATFHAMLDSNIDLLRKHNPTFNPPCSKGCFWCCYEPAYACDAEIDYILEGMNEHQRAQVATNLVNWVARVKDLLPIDEGDALEYRSKHAPCPLLNADGTCSCYDRRPMCCRVFFAMSDAYKCGSIEERRHQLFASYPEALHAQAFQFLLFETGGIQYDHIGCLLHERLMGASLLSGSRHVMIVQEEEACPVA